MRWTKQRQAGYITSLDKIDSIWLKFVGMRMRNVFRNRIPVEIICSIDRRKPRSFSDCFSESITSTVERPYWKPHWLVRRISSGVTCSLRRRICGRISPACSARRSNHVWSRLQRGRSHVTSTAWPITWDQQSVIDHVTPTQFHNSFTFDS